MDKKFNSPTPKNINENEINNAYLLKHIKSTNYIKKSIEEYALLKMISKLIQEGDLNELKKIAQTNKNLFHEYGLQVKKIIIKK